MKLFTNLLAFSFGYSLGSESQQSEEESPQVVPPIDVEPPEDNVLSNSLSINPSNSFLQRVRYEQDLSIPPVIVDRGLHLLPDSSDGSMSRRWRVEIPLKWKASSGTAIGSIISHTACHTNSLNSTIAVRDGIGSRQKVQTGTDIIIGVREENSSSNLEQALQVYPGIASQLLGGGPKTDWLVLEWYDVPVLSAVPITKAIVEGPVILTYPVYDSVANSPTGPVLGTCEIWIGPAGSADSLPRIIMA